MWRSCHCHVTLISKFGLIMTQRQMRDSLVPKYHCNVNFTLKRAYLCLPKNSGGRLEGSGAATGSTLMMGDGL